MRLCYPTLVVCLAVLPLAAQDKKADDKPAPKTKHTLPKLWSKLMLTPEQKAKVYAVQDENAAKIAELRKKIAEIQDAERKALGKILTAEQKKKLAELVGAAEETAPEKK
jgi:Spy/CpxP family protein refolding chaperone